jgi:hypothetical protein
MRRGCLLAVLLIAIALGAIVVVIARPARLAGVSDDALSSSLNDELPKDQRIQCRESDGGSGEGTAWSCDVTTAGAGSGTTYLVEADDWGCWDARWAGGVLAPGEAERVSGCIGILNYVFD